MRHFLSVGRLQSDNEYKKDFAKTRSQFHSRPDQPSFLQAKRSQQLASDVHYRQPLPQPTCDPEQLGLKHAQKAHRLQSDVSCPPLGPRPCLWFSSPEVSIIPRPVLPSGRSQAEIEPRIPNMIAPEEMTSIPAYRALPAGQAPCQMLSMLCLVALTTSRFTDGEPEA